jgi:uncharacterized membrane protein
MTSRILASIPILLAIDSIWLSTAGAWAIRVAEKIQGETVTFRLGAAAIVYVAMAYLLSYAHSLYDAVVIGTASYAVYDFTTYAILKDYDWRLAIADTLWGGVLFGIAFTVLRAIGY